MYHTNRSKLTDGLGVSPNQIAIASQATVYTSALKIGAMSAMSLAIYLTGSSPNVKVELQVSDTAPSALENLNDSVGIDWCIQEGGAPIFTAITDNVLHKITLSPVVCEYVRLKITGNSGNGAGVVAFASIVEQMQLGV